MNDSANPLLRLLGSSKGLVALLVILASFIILALGRANWDQVEGLVKWTVTAWFAARAADDVTKNISKKEG